MESFIQLNPKEFNDNVFHLIGSDWMLITAGTPERYNTMTASWGGMGVLWNKNVCTVYIRPTRYTFEFMEANPTFSLCFFESSFRSALNLCGKKSGRDIDKAKETGLIPVAGEHGTVLFSQARLVFECKKLYHHDINPQNFLDENIESMYPLKDYHRLYVGEILRIGKKNG